MPSTYCLTRALVRAGAQRVPAEHTRECWPDTSRVRTPAVWERNCEEGGGMRSVWRVQRQNPAPSGGLGAGLRWSLSNFYLRFSHLFSQ